MKRIVILTVILLTTLNLSSYAQVKDSPIPRSKSTATAIAFSGIVVPVVGPGFGHLYAGQTKQFKKGAIIRGVCFGIALLAGASLAVRDAEWGAPFEKGRGTGGHDELVALIVISGAGYLISTIYDIGTAAKSAAKYNREHGFAENIHLTPTYMPDKKAVGLALTANF